MANDPKTPEIAREQELQQQRKRYTQFSGNQPTVENIRMSLSVKDVQGEKTGELVAALKLIVLDKDKIEKDAFSKEISACFDKNLDNDIVQVMCADALVHIDRAQGIELSRKILDNPKKSLDSKLLVAKHLVNEKVLIGYSILLEGLLTPDDFQRKNIVLPLLYAFFAYDGKVYGEKGEMIDIKSLIADAKNNTKEQKVLDDLEKAELKYSKKSDK
ncbi:MAG: hypothetical protein A2X45_24465 [Lentisphaerae bacterium GWF2_50_93]|nr:MAG: hypothetical protein A2X45_24465 [Lentisphaerae bacterium GWF2_50_93]